MIPFFCEPFFAIVMPLQIMKRLLRSTPGVRGREAEKSLFPFLPMDFGRYGDIFLNVNIVCLVFFSPPGETLKLFLAMLISQAYVYVYDRYRVLRATPRFCFSSMSTDLCA